jgi:MFS family permease
MFFSAASVAGAFSGLLAFGIAKMEGVGGLEGWRWIFILEGIVTVLVAIMAFFTLYDFPETASFLTEEERAFVVFRLKYQSQVRRSEQGAAGRKVAEAAEFSWGYVWSAFRDWQIWVNIFVYWAVRLTVPHSCSSANSDRRSCVHSTESAYSSLRLFETSVTHLAKHNC